MYVGLVLYLRLVAGTVVLKDIAELETSVKFPFKGLDMSPFASTQQSGDKRAPM